jgi:hypothetical protein
LVAPEISILAVAPTVAVAVSLVAGLFNVIIDISPFQHLAEIQRHPIKYDPGLGICIHVFVGGSGDGRSTQHQLRAHQHNDDHNDDRHE